MARVLIVDDSEFITESLSDFLRSDGHEVVGVGFDGDEGLEKFRELRPDLTLLDITMPNRSGRDCLAKMLELDPSARVLMVSAVKAASTVLDCLELGAAGYVEKPLRFSDPAFRSQLSETIGEALEHARP